MAEGAGTPVRHGHALRLHQVLIVLAAGWLVGRMPQLLTEMQAQAACLRAEMTVESLAQPQPAAALPADADSLVSAQEREAMLVANVAAQVAADVATRVADETVARLLAAGWGPRGVALPPVVRLQQQPVPDVESGSPGRSSLAGWTLEPVAPAPHAPVARETTVSDITPGREEGQAAAHAKAHRAADDAYTALRAGNRRAAAQGLRRALAMAPDAPQAGAWAADLGQLNRRWSVSAYTLARDGASGDSLAASPVLGGGQSGATISYALDPLARRPLSAIARITAASTPAGTLDRETAEAALGLRWKPLPGTPLAIDVERRIALGIMARNDWALRLSGGGQHRGRLGGMPLHYEGYAEAGLVGFRASPDLYAGGQARAATPLASLGRVSFDAGLGGWAAMQRDLGVAASRVDIGPSTGIAIAPWPFHARIDYRLRAAGNAMPGSGPVVTVAGSF